MRTRIISLDWQHGDRDYVADVEISGGYVPGSRWEPAEWPDADVIAVEDDQGTDHPELVLAADADEDLARRALDAATEEDVQRYTDALEARAEWRTA